MAECLPYNFSWIIPEVLAGCGVPDYASELNYLNNIGITLLISLSPETPPHHSLKQLKNIRHEKFACEDFEGIPVSVLQKIVSSIENEILRNGKVTVHCRGGNGRTGTVLAAFSMKTQGITAQEAIKEIRKTRRWSVETREQENCLKDYENYLKTSMETHDHVTSDQKISNSFGCFNWINC